MKRNHSVDNQTTANDIASYKYDRLHIKSLLLMLYDIVASALAYFLALWLRFDCRFSSIPNNYLTAWLKFAPLYAVICAFIFWLFHLYQSIWKFASFVELKRILLAISILGIFHSLTITFSFTRMPISYYIIGISIQLLLSIFVRFSYRFVSLERSRRSRVSKTADASRVMLIGAGSAGRMVLRELNDSDKLNERVCCIIDDNPGKHGCYVEGVPVVGGREDILLNAQKYDIQKIYLTMPGASAKQKRDILNICKETDCQLKSLPGIYEITSGKVTANSIRDVAVEDLLGREPVQVNMDEIYSFISGKVILVTGGGGSIGSELCRQIAQHNPKLLIIFDIYENNAHNISLELRDKYPSLNLEVLIGSVRDSRRLYQVFDRYRPEVVYHAAAHKHVPLMEDSPCEAIKNNAVGTYKTAYAAMIFGVKRFVLISTDKAVNPTNVMGASKRLCEMIIQSFDRKIRSGKASDIHPINLHSDDPDAVMPETALDIEPVMEFVAVRFGNVLGSNGSVVPRFKEQIAKGGPVTVTHPDIVRYFMTIPEAASLVLQAGVYANGGEIFVLDMGDPVKIDTLAKNLIRLSGFKPDVDIKIEYTGLRPGEKLYEEKLMAEEGLRVTPNKLIHIGSPIPFDSDVFLASLPSLLTAAYLGDADTVKSFIRTWVDGVRI